MMTAPDLAAVLSLRLSAELSRLDDVRAMLPLAISPETPQATGLSNRLAAATSSVREVRAEAVQDARSAWQTWSEQAKDADPLIGEVVSMLMTRLLRESQLDRGVFAAAEALLTELTKAAGVSRVVISQTQDVESVDHLRSAVSMRFPGARVWGLPILVHEFGHHLVAHLKHREPALADQRPLQDVVDRAARMASDSSTGLSHAHELVADAVATVVLGPTYPVACLCLRVPSSIDRSASPRSATHPSWNRRIATTRAVLEELTTQSGQARFSSQGSAIVDPLTTTVLGTSTAADDVVILVAEGVVKAIRKHRPGLAYNGADAAIVLADRLSAGCSDGIEAVTVTTILDAAWRWRLAHADRDESEVAETIVDWCYAAAKEVAKHDDA